MSNKLKYKKMKETEIKNVKIYQEKLDESIEIRKEINEELWTEMKSLSKSFFETTGCTNKEFISVKNHLYYKGGYPNENSRARLENTVENFVSLCRILDFLGRTDDLNEYLKTYGLKIEILNPMKKDKLIINAANKIMNKALELQAIICEKADIIKITNAQEIDEQCEIIKNHFIKEVNLNVKKQKGSKTEGIDEKFDKEIISAEKINKRIHLI